MKTRQTEFSSISERVFTNCVLVFWFYFFENISTFFTLKPYAYNILHYLLYFEKSLYLYQHEAVPTIPDRPEAVPTVFTIPDRPEAVPTIFTIPDRPEAVPTVFTLFLLYFDSQGCTGSTLKVQPVLTLR